MKRGSVKEDCAHGPKACARCLRERAYQVKRRMRMHPANLSAPVYKGLHWKLPQLEDEAK